MSFKIGFSAQETEKDPAEIAYTQQTETTPRKSLVEVYFERRNTTLTYYNDQFDLKKGDLVFVEGSMEGLRGRITDVNYNFKIKLSAYKRVIAVADTTVNGKFFTAESHFITFERAALPKTKVLSWFKAPETREDEIVISTDDSTFRLDDLSTMKVSAAIAERGHEYYVENKVKYLSLDGEKGYAIVEGGEAYEVEFTFRNGEISQLVCSCFCSYDCKHEFAAILQLKETLENVSKHYAEEYAQSEYFAAITKGTLFAYAIDGKEKGSFTL